MENLENLEEIIYDSNESDNLEIIFTYDYANQNLDNNIKFQEWKNSMIKKYGNDAKLFRCEKDKILFYSSYKDCISLPCYRNECPKCRTYICYFCSYSNNNIKTRCCFKKAISEQLFYWGLKFIKLVDKQDVELKKISNNYTIFFTLIPGINFYLIYTAIISNCLFQLKTKNSISEEPEIYDDIFYSNKCIFYTGILTSIILFIPLFIYNIYFILLLILVSIPFKFYPLKYFFGFIDGDYYDYY